jgi:hypothetical protein
MTNLGREVISGHSDVAEFRRLPPDSPEQPLWDHRDLWKGVDSQTARILVSDKSGTHGDGPNIPEHAEGDPFSTRRCFQCPRLYNDALDSISDKNGMQGDRRNTPANAEGVHTRIR